MLYFTYFPFLDPLLSVDEWCQASELNPEIATVLKKCGYHNVSLLENITEDRIEDLPELSWLLKAKLWVALENHRLNEFYEKSQNELRDILKLFSK